MGVLDQYRYYVKHAITMPINAPENIDIFGAEIIEWHMATFMKSDLALERVIPFSPSEVFASLHNKDGTTTRASRASLPRGARGNILVSDEGTI